MLWVSLLLFMQSALPPQMERGRTLFFGASNGCSTCHALEGRGTAVGPDLARIARLSPRAIAIAIRSTLTQYVQNVKLKNQESFPAMPRAQNEKSVEIYDLSKTPPELRKIDRAEVASMTNNETWKHPPGLRAYTAEQMADVIAYIRYAAYGDKKGVDPSDVE